jgi:hypothetical protein
LGLMNISMNYSPEVGSQKLDENRDVRRCPYCQATTRQYKHGKTKAGSQRFHCKQCNRKYTPEPRERGKLTSKAKRETNIPEDKLNLPRPVRPPQPDPGTVTQATISVQDVVPITEISLIRSAYTGPTLQPAQPLADAIPVEENSSFLEKAALPAVTNQRWGWLPEIALLQSCSLLLLAWTFVQARAGSPWSELFFWIGLALLIVPVAGRLISTEASRQERISLLLLLGGAFYIVKVMHSPYAFTFPDEFSTFRNVREILENQRLFNLNPELQATALYPGLASITSIVVLLSGLPTYSAGLLVVSAARLVLFLALFLLYERVSGSARIAGLATLFYMANTNFLFYTAEFSYESLALPMAVFVLYLVVQRETTKDHRLIFTVIALLGVFMVVISHHMTSYILTALLFVAAGLSILRTWGKQRGPLDLALFAAIATSFWLFYVATYTIKYLSPVLGRAVRSILRLAVQEETSRQLFKSSSTGYVSPVWEQSIVFGSLLIIALGLLVGWFNVWRHHRNQQFFLFLGGIALGFLPIQGLRLTSAGWETANRSSEFLFIGVGFTLSLAIDQLWRSGWIKREYIWIPSVTAVVLIFGGFIAGWPPQARMPRPYLVDAGSHIVKPQIVNVAEWILDHLGPDHHIATSKSGSKVLSAYGEQAPYTGGAYGIKDMLLSDVVGRGEVEIIQGAAIEYVVSERQRISWDYMIGYYFLNRKSNPVYEFLEFDTYEKFDDQRGVNRILDSGNIVVYDVRTYLDAPLEGQETPAIAAQPSQATTVQPHSADGGIPPGRKKEGKKGGRELIFAAFVEDARASIGLETPNSQACIPHCRKSITSIFKSGYESTSIISPLK